MAIKYRNLVTAALFSVLSVGSALTMPLNAVAADKEETAPAFLQVSPTKQRLSLEPGDSYDSTFKVQNIGGSPFSYKAYSTPYNVVDEDYTSDYNKKEAHSQMSDWVKFDESTVSGELKAGESVDVKFTVNVPKDAPAGGQYASIMAETSDGSSEANNIRTINRVGMILYASVAGETKEEGSVIENKIPGFVLTPPLTATSLVENTGNIEATADYVFKIWPLFGGETVFNNEDQKGSLDIMPGTKRFGTISWDGAPQVGVFWVEQTINFLGKTSTNKKLVVICPLWLLFVILAIIFAIIFWLVSRFRARKKGNKTTGTSSNEAATTTTTRSRKGAKLINKFKKSAKKGETKSE